MITPDRRALVPHTVLLFFIILFSCISFVFTSARKSHLTHPGAGWLSCFEWRHILMTSEMNVAVKWRHWNIYEWRRKFIRYCKIYSALINANIKPIPFVSIFISKNDKQEKGTITSNQYGWFPALGTCFCNTSAEPRYCVNSPPQDWKIPSTPVTGERFL